MKSFFNKIAVSSLAITVLFSSFSFTINQHICGGKIANTEFFISADNCGMQMMACKNKNSNREKSVEKEPCCNDISTLIPNVDTNQQPKNVRMNFPFALIISTVIHSFVRQKKTRAVSFFTYRPPLIYKDVQTFFQVFRI